MKKSFNKKYNTLRSMNYFVFTEKMLFKVKNFKVLYLNITQMVEKVASGLDLAKEFYQLAIEEFATGERLKQKDGCEKGFRAATEALDTMLALKGYAIDIGTPRAHPQRRNALSILETIDPTIKTISRMYSTFIDDLHGICFYTNEDPKLYYNRLIEVKDFIKIIENMY